MNRFASILLLVLVLLHLAAPAWMTGLFVMNRVAIEQAHCVNRAKPELACHGQCFLSRQLAGGLSDESTENTDKLQPPIPWWPVFRTEQHAAQREKNAQSPSGPEPALLRLAAWPKGIFHPPEWLC